MPWFSYRCDNCKNEFRLILEERAKTAQCKCGCEAKNILKPAHVKVVEQLDNGLMARKVERIHNIEEILTERSDKFSVPSEENDDE